MTGRETLPREGAHVSALFARGKHELRRMRGHAVVPGVVIEKFRVQA